MANPFKTTNFGFDVKEEFEKPEIKITPTTQTTTPTAKPLDETIDETLVNQLKSRGVDDKTIVKELSAPSVLKFLPTAVKESLQGSVGYVPEKYRKDEPFLKLSKPDQIIAVAKEAPNAAKEILIDFGKSAIGALATPFAPGKEEVKIPYTNQTAPTFLKTYNDARKSGLSPFWSGVLTTTRAAGDVLILDGAFSTAKFGVTQVGKIPVTKPKMTTLNKQDLMNITRGEEFAGKIAPEKLNAFQKLSQEGIDWVQTLKKTGEINVKTGKPKTLAEAFFEQAELVRQNEQGFAKIPKLKIKKQPITTDIAKAKAEGKSFEEFKQGIKDDFVKEQMMEPKSMKTVDAWYQAKQIQPFVGMGGLNPKFFEGEPNLSKLKKSEISKYQKFTEDGKAIVYRGIDKNVKSRNIRWGDFVSPDKGKASFYGKVERYEVEPKFIQPLGDLEAIYYNPADKLNVPEVKSFSQLKQLWDKDISKLPEVKRPTTTKKRVLAELKKERSDKEFLISIKKDINDVFVKARKDKKEFLPEIERQIEDTIAKQLKTTTGKERSRIAFIRKIAEFKQPVITEIKKELGLTKPITKLNLIELEKMTVKLKERFKFKRELGFKPTVGKIEQKPVEIPESIYQANLAETGIKPSGRKKEEFKEQVDKTLGTISSRIADIDPSLRVALRKFEFTSNNAILKDTKEAIPFLKQLKDMDKKDFATFDFAAKNGDVSKQNELAKKYGFQQELVNLRKQLDNIYKRANNVGFDIGYRKDYFPRIIKDTKGLVKFFSEGATEVRSIIAEAVKRKEMDLGRSLIVDEKAYLINNMIRGYSGGQITLSAISNMKGRIIDFITPEINKYYFDTSTSLVKYINSVNNAIEARKFFGKSRPVDKKVDQFNNIDDSIGVYIFDLLAKGKITPKQEIELRDILNARFGERGTNGVVSLYKNLAYIDVMGSPMNALTQIGDLAFPLYNILTGRAGAFSTANSLIRSIFNTSKIKKEDIGIEKIALEFESNSKSANAVDRVFRTIGLTKMDSIGKETLINPIIARYQKLAKNPTDKFRKEMDLVFEDESTKVIADLKKGEITENVKFLTFYKLLDFQPVAKSEVPQRYLTGGNGRVFYMLKTWTIKMFDVYRNEVFRTMKTNKAEGIRNMLFLTMSLVLMNATADELKDLMLGRKTSFKDRMIDNIAKLIGFSRYSIDQIARDGLGQTIAGQILPPTSTIDNISKDVRTIYKDYDESVKVNELRSIKSIPVIGKLYYWWFGKGETFKEKRKEEPKLKLKSTRLQQLPKLKVKKLKLKKLNLQ